MTAQDDDELDVELFKELVRICTVYPDPDLPAAVVWLRKQAQRLGMQVGVFDFSAQKNRPVVVLTLPGSNPSLPAVGLNCHMDVVPVETNMWTALPPGETPFSAWEDPATGRIYGRGTQDMKCVGAQYLSALRRLMVASRTGSAALFPRTIHTIWVPDEEIGGAEGMKQFVASDVFRALNLGVVMDEGLAHEDKVMVVYVGERTAMWVRFDAEGPAGHGSKLLAGTAVDRLARAVHRLTAQRDWNVCRLAGTAEGTRCGEGAATSSGALPTPKPRELGDVTTWNITALQAGVTSDGGRTFAPNVVPGSAYCLVDIRAAASDFQAVLAEIDSIAADNQLTVTFLGKHFDPAAGPSPYSHRLDSQSPLGAIPDAGSWWYSRIHESLSKWGHPVDARIFPAATDSRYVRRAGVPAFGFSPMPSTPSLLHDHNEYLERSVYLQGVRVYMDLIAALAGAPDLSRACL